MVTLPILHQQNGHIAHTTSTEWSHCPYYINRMVTLPITEQAAKQEWEGFIVIFIVILILFRVDATSNVH